MQNKDGSSFRGKTFRLASVRPSVFRKNSFSTRVLLSWNQTLIMLTLSLYWAWLRSWEYCWEKKLFKAVVSCKNMPCFKRTFVLFRNFTAEFLCTDSTRTFHRGIVSVYIPRVWSSVDCSCCLGTWSTAWWEKQGKAAHVSIVLCDVIAPSRSPHDSHHSSHNVQWPGTRLCFCGLYKGRISLV